jgi:2-keto-4-pentenoate hydratase/2-oxohepta-3-ene-1,7-dioic acid hydratase in catechol pathway
MKYVTFSPPNEPSPRIGVVHEDRVVDLESLVARAWRGKFPETLLALIQAGPDTWREMARLVGGELARHPAIADGRYPLEEIRWLAPIPRPRKNIVCLGLNYMNHLLETSRPLQREAKMPEVPIFFTKAPTTVSGPRDVIPWDRSVTEQVDYEAELGVVLGVDGKNIPRGRSLEHVFGYTVVNDVSARDLQYRHKQWFKGKSLDGFCPMGPCIVTADEFGDPQRKRLSLRINGETRQDATTGDMIFAVDAIIEILSRGMLLEAGDIIATGTPEGVGLGRIPPAYLNDGDLVETEIEGIGTLRNRVAATTTA